MISLRILVLMALLSANLSAAENWPQFRGPDGQGHAQVGTIPTAWSETDNIVWKTPIAGRGWSSPVVWGNQIWFTTALDEGKSLQALCVDARSGKIVHEIEVFQVAEPLKINAKNSHASPTPVIEAGRVYVHFGTAGTACLNTATGEILWKNQDLKLDHKEGPGSSPILWRDLLLVNCDGTDVQYVAALNKTTGKLAWKTNRPGPLNSDPDLRKAYSTPLVIERDGRPQLVSTGADQVIAYDPATGEQFWRLPYQGFSNVPRPIEGKNGIVYICTGYMKPQIWAIRPGTNPEVVWKFTKQVPSNPSPVLVDNRIYMVSDQGVLTCLDAASGDELFKERLGGGYSASLTLANGHIYIPSEDGRVTVINPSDKFDEVAVNTLDGSFMASPAFVGKAIILRSDTHLYRIEAGAVRTAAVNSPTE